MRWFKRLALYSGLSLVGYFGYGHLNAQAGPYDSVVAPEIVSTAVQDGQKSANNPANLYKKMAQVVKMNNDGANRIGNAGLLIGSTDSTSSVSALSNIRTPLSLSNVDIKQIDTEAKAPIMEHYRGFGMALNDLVSRGESRDASSISFEPMATSFSKVSAEFSRVTLDFIKKYNPATLIAAFYDHTKLDDQSNELMKWLNLPEAKNFKDFIYFFSEPITTLNLPRIVYLTLFMMIFWLLLTPISVILGNQKFGMAMRKFIARLLIMGMGIPLASNLATEAINVLSQSTQSSIHSQVNEVLSSHLNLQDWYASGFALPVGDYTIVDGQFNFTAEQIKSINLHSAKLLGYPVDKEEHQKALADRMIRMATLNNNRTMATFNPQITDTNANGQQAPQNLLDMFISFLGSLAQEGARIDDLKKIAEDMANNSKASVPNSTNAYVRPGSISMSTTDASKNTYKITSHSEGPGLNPISAYNVMRTEFTPNNMTAKTNIATIFYPSIVTHARSLGSSGSVPGFISFYAQIIMLVTAIKVLFMLIYTAFGGIFKGAPGAAMGSAAGLGELIGGVIALVFGLVGIGIIMGITDSLLTLVWEVFANLLKGGSNDQLNGILKPIRDQLSGMWLVGGMLAGLFTSIAELTLNIIIMVAAPKIVTIPIKAFGEYVQGIPERFAERGQHFVNQFTGDYRAGGGRHRFTGQSTRDALGKTSDALQRQKLAAAGIAGVAGGLLAKKGLEGVKSLWNKANSKDDEPTDNKPESVENEKPPVNHALDSEQTGDNGIKKSINEETGQRTESGINSDGHKVSNTYDADGNLQYSTVTDEENGITKTQDFDKDGNVVAESVVDNDGRHDWQKHEDGSISQKEQLKDGSQRETVQQPDGTKQTISTLPDGTKSIATETPDGHKTQSTMEADGSMKTVDEDGNVTHSVPNSAGGFDSVTEHANGDISRESTNDKGEVIGSTNYKDGQSETHKKTGQDVEKPLLSEADRKLGIQSTISRQQAMAGTRAGDRRTKKNSMARLAAKGAANLAQSTEARKIANHATAALAAGVGASDVYQERYGKSKMMLDQEAMRNQQMKGEAAPTYQRYFGENRNSANDMARHGLAAGGVSQEAIERNTPLSQKHNQSNFKSYEEMKQEQDLQEVYNAGVGNSSGGVYSGPERSNHKKQQDRENDIAFMEEQEELRKIYDK